MRMHVARQLSIIAFLSVSLEVAAHECTAKVRPTSWDVTKDSSGKAQASVAFSIEGGMWMTTDWGPLKCTVLWEYQVFWVDEADKEQSYVYRGSERFFGPRGKQGERVSDNFETEVSEASPFMYAYGSPTPKRILRVIVRDTKTSTTI